MSEGAAPAAQAETPTGTRGRRLRKVGLWLAGVLAAVVLLDLLGVDVTGWLTDLWHQIQDIPAGYLVLGLVAQTGQTMFAGASYYGILRAAYPGQVSFMPIVTAYAVGVAMNGFLPANIGTFVTLVMFVALIPAATAGGAFAAYLVQKIFFTLVGAVVYAYLFLSVPGSFDLNLGNMSEHPAATVTIVLGGAALIVVLARIFWRQVKKLWNQAKQGGVILAHPRRYFTHAFLPSFVSWLCKLAVIAIFLAAFAIPVTVDSVLWIVGSGSLANVASFTPGAVGVTQATNALALDTCCDVARSTSIAYSSAQQLIVTAWNVLFGTILVISVFGWTGGKQLVGGAYVDAKQRAADMREARKEHRAEA